MSKAPRKPNITSAEEEILLVLLGSGKLYGLQIRDSLEDHDASIPSGSLYPTLYKLDERGLVKSTWGEDIPGERGNARRKYYEITKEGIFALESREALRLELRKAHDEHSSLKQQPNYFLASMMPQNSSHHPLFISFATALLVVFLISAFTSDARSQSILTRTGLLHKPENEASLSSAHSLHDLDIFTDAPSITWSQNVITKTFIQHNPKNEAPTKNTSFRVEGFFTDNSGNQFNTNFQFTQPTSIFDGIFIPVCVLALMLLLMINRLLKKVPTEGQIDAQFLQPLLPPHCREEIINNLQIDLKRKIRRRESLGEILLSIYKDYPFQPDMLLRIWIKQIHVSRNIDSFVFLRSFVSRVDHSQGEEILAHFYDIRSALLKLEMNKQDFEAQCWKNAIELAYTVVINRISRIFL